MSPRRLHLQIICKSGASIERILASWGTLPLVVRFKGGLKSTLLPKNIAIALRHPDRVREIDLGLTSTTVGSIVDAIKKPFQILERIRIAIKDATGPPLPFGNAFLGGSAPRLREIALDGISFPFPEIKQVISTNNLVELHLLRIPKTGYFSADALVTALSTSAELRRLELSFHYPASLPTQSKTSPPLQRTTFPFLQHLEFHGASEYLEDFVSRVDFPSLSFINIKLFNQIFFEIPQFCRSISLLNAFKSPAEAWIGLHPKVATMYFKQKGKRGTKSGVCYLKTVCERLDWKLSFLTQVSSQLSLPLKSVGTLEVYVSLESCLDDGFDETTLVSREDHADATQWVELFQPFAHARLLRVPGIPVRSIVQALATEDMAAGVLPELTQLLFFGWFCHNPPVVEAAQQFVAARKLSGRTIYLSI